MAASSFNLMEGPKSEANLGSRGTEERAAGRPTMGSIGGVQHNIPQVHVGGAPTVLINKDAMV
jgi:hypothetical protein